MEILYILRQPLVMFSNLKISKLKNKTLIPAEVETISLFEMKVNSVLSNMLTVYHK